MSDKSKIEWTDASWSPVVGCTKVSAGCKNCYAERMAYRLKMMGQSKYFSVVDTFRGEHLWTNKIYCGKKSLEIPLHWRKPRRIFVCSMGDLFHEKVPFEFINRVFEKIYYTPQHIYQILTKRPSRMAEYIQNNLQGATPSKNVWLGVTCENQKEMWRTEKLFHIPTVVSWWSVEPMLSEITFGHFIPDWLVIGAESGPKRRECKLEWVRDLVGQCKAAGVAVFVKQLSINGKVEHDIKKIPEDLRLREWPGR